MLKIAVAIEPYLIREVIKLVVRNIENSILIFTAEDIKFTIKKMNRYNPKFLIIDYLLTQDTYYNLTQLKKNNPDCKIILLIDNMKKESIPLNKIDGVIHKNLNSQKLEESLNRLKEYEKLSLSELEGIDKLNFIPEKNNYHLTERQKQILKQLLNKRTNRIEIAETLNISKNTVDNHLNQLFKKLSVHNKIQAVTKALKKDLVQFSSIEVK